MVLGENVSAHAPVAGGTDSASRWINQQYSVKIFIKNAYIED
jgi:hypothetical protein